jgi:hypothetical protein
MSILFLYFLKSTLAISSHIIFVFLKFACKVSQESLSISTSKSELIPEFFKPRANPPHPENNSIEEY